MERRVAPSHLLGERVAPHQLIRQVNLGAELVHPRGIERFSRPKIYLKDDPKPIFHSP